MIHPQRFRSLGFVTALAAACVGPGALAQPGATAPLVSVSTSVSYSASSDLDHEGAALGEVAVTALQFGTESSLRVGEVYRFGYGLSYTHLGLDGDARTPLPDELQALALPLSLAGPIAEHWLGRLMLSPGLYGRSLELQGRQFNVPVLALASYRQSSTLTWSIGARYDAWSKYPLLPLVGTQWKFAPDWEFSVGLPRTGVSWEFHRDATLRLGASYQGGSFYLPEDRRPAIASLPSLSRTRLDYREIRVGAALDLLGRGTFSLVLEAGVIVSQRFDYERTDYQIDGSSAAYAALSTRWRF